MKEIASPRPRVGVRNDEFYFVNSPEPGIGLYILTAVPDTATINMPSRITS